MQEHQEDAGEGYQESFVGAPPNPREQAEAEILVSKHRGETLIGLNAELRAQLAEERAHAQKLREENDRQRKVIEAEIQHRRNAVHDELQLQRHMVHEELQRRREDANASLQLAEVAVAAAFANIERAKQTATVLNRPAPPRTTAGENLTDFGKHLVSEVAGAFSVVFAGDADAQKRIRQLGTRMLKIATEAAQGGPANPDQQTTAPESDGAATAAGPAPASDQEAAPQTQTDDASAQRVEQPPAAAMSAVDCIKLAQMISTLKPEWITAFLDQHGIGADQFTVEHAQQIAKAHGAA